MSLSKWRADLFWWQFIFCFRWHLWIFHGYSINLSIRRLLIHHWCDALGHVTDAIEYTGCVISRLLGIIIVGYGLPQRSRRSQAPSPCTLIFFARLCFFAVCSYLFTYCWQSVHKHSRKPHKPWLSDCTIKYSYSSLLESQMFKDCLTVLLRFVTWCHWGILYTRKDISIVFF